MMAPVFELLVETQAHSEVVNLARAHPRQPSAPHFLRPLGHSLKCRLERPVPVLVLPLPAANPLLSPLPVNCH